jgi:transposase
MIPHGVEIFVGLEPIDLRWGFERLAGLVEELLDGLRVEVPRRGPRPH